VWLKARHNQYVELVSRGMFEPHLKNVPLRLRALECCDCGRDCGAGHQETGTEATEASSLPLMQPMCFIP